MNLRSLSLAPDERLDVALVGIGAWGQRLLRALVAAPSLALRWVCDRDPSRLAAVSQETTARQTRHWGEILAAPDVRAVVIAVGPEANGELALEALRAGKHVLIEKPFATGLELGARIAEEAEARGLVAGVGHILRYHPAFQTVDRLLASGAIGAARGCVSQRLGPHRKRALGPWWVLAPHDLSLAIAWLGNATCELSNEGERVDASLRFEGGGLGRFYLGAQERSRRRFVLLAERALVTVDEADPERGVVSYPVSDGQAALARDLLSAFAEEPFAELDLALQELLAKLPARPVAVPRGDALQTQLAAFSTSVREGTELATSVRASLPILEVLVEGEGCDPSVRSGSRAAVPPEPRAALLETHGAA